MAKADEASRLKVSEYPGRDLVSNSLGSGFEVALLDRGRPAA